MSFKIVRPSWLQKMKGLAFWLVILGVALWGRLLDLEGLYPDWSMERAAVALGIIVGLVGARYLVCRHLFPRAG